MRDDRSTDTATRRNVLRGGLTAVAATAAAVLVTTQRAEAKIQPKAVHYVDETPKPAQNCANCVNYVEPKGCKIVEGEVLPNGWCQVWAAAPKKPA